MWIRFLIPQTFGSLRCDVQQRQQVHHREGRRGGRATTRKWPLPQTTMKKARLWSLENMKWQRVPFVWELTWCKADTVHPLGVDLQSGSNARTRSVGRDGERTGTRGEFLILIKIEAVYLSVTPYWYSIYHFQTFCSWSWQFYQTSGAGGWRETTCGFRQDITCGSNHRSSSQGAEWIYWPRIHMFVLVLHQDILQEKNIRKKKQLISGGKTLSKHIV